MYDIRQFKPALYLLLLLGISGFALAAQLPGLWLLAVGCILLNGWLVANGRFRPMSRWVANLITIASLLYVIRELVTSLNAQVVVIGEFLVFLQLVKLWEQRANRDYGQLLMLSLLLVVAASMNTASLLFGVILVLYLFLSLYCCLLFHLKVETDAAKAALPVAEEKISPGTLRQDQRNLARSLRKLTALVAGVAISSAVVVFVFAPRGSGAGMLGPMQPFHNATSLTGFSDRVTFQDVAKITQSRGTVAFVKVWHNDQLVEGDRTLLLRGLTLEAYGPASREGDWGWTRTVSALSAQIAHPDEPIVLLKDPPADVWKQQIALMPTRTDVLFALAGVSKFTPRISLKVKSTREDGALQTAVPLVERVDYEVISSNDPSTGDKLPFIAPSPTLRVRFPRIFEFARRADVSGSDSQGPLAPRRIAQGERTSKLDEQIATNIEYYLRTRFTYTLDLTDEKRFQGRDPIESFLYDWKKGHCEYFAGAMTLMCQTLGMQARMVIGFKCDGEDYNGLNGLYTVHESDAHAWVEVKTDHGWKAFDPTSSIGEGTTQGAGLLARGRHLLEYLEYTYANAVIAYDSQNRQSVIAALETGMATAASYAASSLNDLHEYIRTSAVFWNASTTVLTAFLLLMIAIVAGVSGWYFWERSLLRRRAQRIGIESLPESEKLRLARQLGFYDDLLRLLDRHRIIPPAHLTPMEFSRSLSFLPADAYDTLQRLTLLFYKVRYGGVELPSARRKRLNNVLATLSEYLGPPAEGRSAGRP